MSPEYLSETVVAEKFFPGDLVEVRSHSEILATLDENGTLEKLPFMPEMLKFCGRTLRVSRQAFKTCVDDQDMRRLDNTVFLEEARCDGSSHGGCGRACLIFWKEAWLKRALSLPAPNGGNTVAVDPQKVDAAKATLSDLTLLAGREGQFFCQSSELLKASRPLPWWHAKQYLWDLKYNRISFDQWALSLFIAFYNKVAHVCRFKSWRFVAGPGTVSSPEPPLNLLPGDLVRVKSVSQIRQTLDRSGKHSNLLFAPAMADFCGRVLRVQDRVENIILEGTPHQRKIKNTVLLEGATCDGICHRMCPRQSLLFWRECWLERVVLSAAD